MKTRLVQVSVTAEHIRSGVRAGCEDCPVALAINEHLQPPTLDPKWLGFLASVWTSSVLILDGMGDRLKGCRAIPLPADAYLFIGRFDSGARDTLKPFTFPLRLPVDCLREGS